MSAPTRRNTLLGLTMIVTVVAIVAGVVARWAGVPWWVRVLLVGGLAGVVGASAQAASRLGRPVMCPVCSATQPAGRRPDSLGQALWGGWTCRVCHVRMNRHGHRLDDAEPD